MCCTHIEAGRSGPDTVAFGIEDCGLVDIAGANEAMRGPEVSGVSDRSTQGRKALRYLWSTYAIAAVSHIRFKSPRWVHTLPRHLERLNECIDLLGLLIIVLAL